MAWIRRPNKNEYVSIQRSLGGRRVVQSLGRLTPQLEIVLQIERENRAYASERSQVIRRLFAVETQLRDQVKFAADLTTQYLLVLGYRRAKRGPWQKRQRARVFPGNRHISGPPWTAAAEAWLHERGPLFDRVRSELRFLPRRAALLLNPLDPYSAVRLLGRLQASEARRARKAADSLQDLLATAVTAYRILALTMLSANGLYNMSTDSPNFHLYSGMTRQRKRRQKLLSLQSACRVFRQGGRRTKQPAEFCSGELNRGVLLDSVEEMKTIDEAVADAWWAEVGIGSG